MEYSECPRCGKIHIYQYDEVRCIVYHLESKELLAYINTNVEDIPVSSYMANEEGNIFDYIISNLFFDESDNNNYISMASLTFSDFKYIKNKNKEYLHDLFIDMLAILISKFPNLIKKSHSTLSTMCGATELHNMFDINKKLQKTRMTPKNFIKKIKRLSI